MGSQESVKTKVHSGSPVLGAMVATHSPSMIELVGQIGLDFVWIDLEHTGPSGNDGATVDDLARAGDAAGIPLLVRLPEANPAMIQTVLNAGIHNILVADIASADDAEEVVRSVRFEYDGVGGRGASFSRSNGWGNLPSNYVKSEDRRKCVGVMIENGSAVENIREITSVPGLDFVRIGAADLSISLGHPYDTDHEDVRAAVERVERTCLENGMVLSKKVTEPAELEGAIKRGYRIVTIGRDMRIVREVLTGRHREMERMTEST